MPVHFSMPFEKNITLEMDSNYTQKVQEAVRHGKHVRPWLMRRVCEKMDLDYKPLEAAAMGIEMIHQASLLHDDVIDGDLERRGTENDAAQNGVSHSILFGDFLFLQGMKHFHESQYPPAIPRAVVETVSGMAEHQLKESEGRITDLDAYLAYAEAKTGGLFALCARIPLLYYEMNHPPAETFSHHYGLAYQIADDLSEKHPEKDGVNILHFLPREKAVSRFHTLRTQLGKMDFIPVEELTFIPFIE
ncbi:MAG: polyprenyl synthetase family protein [Candidatus Diapherotrites archaeon]|nr:polyprenyl synthetase family protein [Candidatus Diapherotrites archaeon]MDZ4256670.1 polyprenyl synthetase family protein [archaeon]